MFRNSLDLGVFFAYLLFNIWLGLWVARRKKVSARDYFLAGDRSFRYSN
jgi:Na+/proline symporter